MSVLVAGLTILLAKKIFDPFTFWMFQHILKKDKTWPRDVTLHLHESGIDLTSVHTNINKNTEIAWESIEEVNEDKDRLFLYFDAREAIIIPKNKPALNEAEQQMLRNLFKQHLNPDVVNANGETPQFLK